MKIHLSLLAILTLSACATDYQPRGGTSYGYSHVPMGKNTYLVTFDGNFLTDLRTAQGHASRHASELCEDKGFNNFEIVNQSGAYKTYVKDGVENKPAVELLVKCIEETSVAAE